MTATDQNNHSMQTLISGLLGAQDGRERLAACDAARKELRLQGVLWTDVEAIVQRAVEIAEFERIAPGIQSDLLSPLLKVQAKNTKAQARFAFDADCGLPLFEKGKR